MFEKRYDMSFNCLPWHKFHTTHTYTPPSFVTLVNWQLSKKLEEPEAPWSAIPPSSIVLLLIRPQSLHFCCTPTLNSIECKLLRSFLVLILRHLTQEEPIKIKGRNEAERRRAACGGCSQLLWWWQITLISGSWLYGYKMGDDCWEETYFLGGYNRAAISIFVSHHFLRWIISEGLLGWK